MRDKGTTFQYSRQCHMEKGVDMCGGLQRVEKGRRMRAIKEQILAFSMDVPSPSSFSHR